MNDGSTLNKDLQEDFHIATNSIQQTLFVERLPMPMHGNHEHVKPYDIDNLYPNKVRSIAERSSTVESASDVLSRFIYGSGFDNLETIVNEREGLTAGDIAEFTIEQYSIFKGFAIHVNYDELGNPIEQTPINFDFVRWNSDCSGFIVNPFWGRYYGTRYETEYPPFNPENAKKEIEDAGGIENYKGQLLYSIPKNADLYPRCFFDSVLDDAQFEAEAKLYSLRSIQNDYALSGVIAYPKQIESSQEIKDLKRDFQNDRGAKNAGGFRVFGAPPTEGMQNWKWFTPISRNNIDGLHKEQKIDSRMSIYYRYNQPPILSGVATQGMFNKESFLDAFTYYNSFTQKFRVKMSRELNKVMSYFDINVDIKPATFEDFVADEKNENDI